MFEETHIELDLNITQHTHVVKHHVILHDDVHALSFYATAKINLKEKLSGLI